MKAYTLLMRLCLVTLLMTGCASPEPEEAALVARFEQLIADVEAGDVSSAGEHLHDGFMLDRSGSSHNEQQARLMLAHTLRRFRNIQIVTANVITRIDPVKLTEATIDFNAVVTAGNNWVPEDGNLYRVQSQWRFDDGEWLLFSASSKRALEQ